MSMAGRFSLSLSLSPPLLIPGIMVIARRNDRAVRSLVARNRRPSAMVRQPANVQGSTNLTIPRDHPAKHRFPLADPFSPFAHLRLDHPSFFFFRLSFEGRKGRILIRLINLCLEISKQFLQFAVAESQKEREREIFSIVAYQIVLTNSWIAGIR